MIKVLLLDDEQLALEYLETVVDWRRHGFEIIGRLTDARQALKVFRRERPELIISDICMVGMDGVDFATAVRNIDQRVHILFLSGYKNFDYVHRAIQLGIDDYLLKSDINNEIFLKKLVQIQHKIERERQKSRYTENTVFREIFEKGIEEKHYRGIMNELEYLRLHKRYFFLLCAVKRCPPFILDFLPGAEERWYIDEATVGARIAGIAAQAEIDVAASFRLDEALMLTVLETRPGLVSEKDAFESFYQTIRTSFDALNAMGRLRYDLFYSRERYTVREFGRLYARAKAQMEQSYVFRDARIYELQRNFRRVAVPENVRQFTSERLFQAIVQKEQANLDAFLERLRIAIEQEDAQTYLKLLRSALAALSQVESERVSGDSGRYFSTADAANGYSFYNPEDVVRFITHKLGEVQQLYRGGAEATYSKSIQDAVSYIRENLGVEDLSVGSVARKVNLSSSWLSAKFKEEVGMGISEFLNGIRIQRAKELLSDGDYMIYEVSEQCGFASSQYFSKIFKQLTGMTPNEYRRKNKGSARE